ncbi:MAG TPA: copper-binding protein [Vicinamibacteria bacterium]|nr:copper-binding protein [Vicinamibacteria bacterium]
MPRLAGTALLLLALVSCREGRPRPEPSVPVDVLYPIRGTVKAVAADRRSVTLDHEQIPNLMDAMEMEFGVADPAMLKGIDPGARVEGVLRMRGRGPLITELRRSSNPAQIPDPTIPVRPVR